MWFAHHQILIENEKRTNLCKIIKIKDQYEKKIKIKDQSITIK